MQNVKHFAKKKLADMDVRKERSKEWMKSAAKTESSAEKLRGGKTVATKRPFFEKIKMTGGRFYFDILTKNV